MTTPATDTAADMSQPPPAPDTAPKSEPEKPAATSTSNAPSSESAQGITTGNFTNSTQTINQTFAKEIKAYLLGDTVQGVSIFDWKSHYVFSREEEVDNARNFAYESDFVEASVSTLMQHRMLILHGEHGTGRASMALYLARRLHESGDVGGRTLLYTPPRNSVRLDLIKDLKVREEPVGQILIFRNVLEHENPGVVEFLSNLKTDAAVANVTHELEKRDSHVIFTATTNSLPHGCIGSIPARLCVRLADLSLDVRLEGTKRAISVFFDRRPEYSNLRSSVTPELEQEIAERCRTMSRVVQFIDKSLVAVLRKEASLEDALAASDTLSAWFQRCPESDLETWIYCLAMVIAYSQGSITDVYVSEFAELHTAIRRHVLRWHGLRRAKRPLDEAAMRERVGIALTRDAAFARDLIGFNDPADAARLWSVLISRFPLLTSSLASALLQLTGHDSVSIRAKVAQALGRIGVIDSEMMLTWLRNWAASTSWREKSLVGYLAQGVLSTGDQVYREHLLGMLEWFATKRNHRWTAIVAYKQIAEIELSLAMDKLRGIAESKLAAAFQVDRDITRQLRRLDTELGRIRTAEAAALREILPALGEFYAESLEDEAETAQTFKYTLVSLCLTTGFTSVIGHLRSWALGSSGMEALICLVFLQGEGIASELTARKMVVVNAEGRDESITCNAILASLMGDSAATRIFADFLQTMYAGLLNFFPPDVAAPLTRLIFDYLKEWIRESLRIPPCRVAMVELTACLLRSNLKELRERTFDWLSADPALLENSEMVQFARDARLQAMSPA